jgi:DNA-binding transcriptional regulator YiaG
MSIQIHEKIKLIRESERLNRKEFSELTGIVYGSFCSYEAGDKKPGIEQIMKILQHPLCDGRRRRAGQRVLHLCDGDG